MAQAATAKNERGSDLLVAISIVVILGMMLFPVPTFIVDVMVAFNLTISLITLLVTLYVVEPVQFSIFPSFLVIMTMFRVALGILITRAILINASAGNIINAFGNFVVGGNYVVGIVIFIVLIVVQFIVITSGAQRVAEVAARFTLDAMPGKQMSIDADLNAGLITESQARAKRESISAEADFYGAMDGSTKFIRGDSISSIIIIVVNIIAGFIIGIMQLKMSFVQALQTYTLLTVGAGITLQIPSLLVSVSTGIIVTRAASVSNLGKQIVSQVFSSSRVIAIAAGVSFFMVFIPGIPKIPFIILSGLVGYVAYTMSENQKKDDIKQKKEEEKEKKVSAGTPESVMPLLHFDPVELEIGYALIPLVDPEQGGDLLDSITSIRKQTALEFGIIVPPIRIRDNMNLPPNKYVIKMHGVEVSVGELMVGRYLAMNPGTAKDKIQGYDTTEPTFGLPATWITQNDKNRAVALGYTVVDASAVVTTHITETIKNNASELVGRQEVQALIENVKENYPAVIEELIPKVLTYGEVQKVLHRLLSERVSIRNLLIILETLADYGIKTKDPDHLTEYVRQSLRKQISKQYADEDRVLHVITFDPEIEQNIADSIQYTEQGAFTALAPEYLQRLFSAIADKTEKIVSQGYQPIVLCSSIVRPHLKRMIDKTMPGLVVLAYNEIVPEVEIRSLGMVEMR
ncbi:MAG: flagellar biosynthesis protein FlhA [Candidatus Margulisiibacteriota bacterium]|nr:MAG: flagellar biosynthesis protein FlhA [Candidatus Margulisbacteria bacterium GWD2_39_127]OGI05203.1 MAG: flagellar biosynthesis protein FlhA [Candidatus Margulisbacteria bacterium GWF2_38_17]OGI06252.1 MAG: flagellar biosynthesis protein FlhA [Candidatus Margulisbacteria bacterium GWE2_39_32]PZM78908.1 MAG: flagellar biosynthesis protein FlhA [Candidatus Margulisiibacteriota bacterium]HAR64508.1 flagellar biosynthesis protein FlhA [Candidatus Margulisiibacteriota bacterium]